MRYFISGIFVEFDSNSKFSLGGWGRGIIQITRTCELIGKKSVYKYIFISIFDKYSM